MKNLIYEETYKEKMRYLTKLKGSIQGNFRHDIEITSRRRP